MPQFEIAHRTPGRLRVRFPATWLRRSGAAVERQLRSVGGVRGVTSSDVTGSVRIEYDPFRLAEQSLLTQIETLTHATQRPPSGRAATGVPTPEESTPPVTGRPGATLVGAIGTTSVLVAACLPLPVSVVGPLVLAAELPALLRAVGALRRRRLNGDVLEASTLLALTARRTCARPSRRSGVHRAHRSS